MQFKPGDNMDTAMPTGLVSPVPEQQPQDHHDSGSNRMMLSVKNGTFFVGKNVGLFHLHHNWLRSLHWAFFFFNLQTWYVKKKWIPNGDFHQSWWRCVLACSVTSLMSDSLLPYGLPGSSVHGILQARLWSGLPSSTSRDLPNPGIEPELWSLMSPAFSGRFLPLAPLGKPPW